jgi:hypothetical protein
MVRCFFKEYNIPRRGANCAVLFLKKIIFRGVAQMVRSRHQFVFSKQVYIMKT